LKTFVLLVFLLFSFSGMIFTQNLVKNPSFEEYYICPVSIVLGHNAIDWYGLPHGSTYYNSCAEPYTHLGVPVNLKGYQPARTGNAYASVTVVDETSLNWEGIY